jgi:hypothetical protein
MVYTIASRDRPKANETPRKPILSPAKTALPQLAKTSTNVPSNSAIYLFNRFASFMDNHTTTVNECCLILDNLQRHCRGNRSRDGFNPSLEGKSKR